jgi:REP element-mobilizing transposase RayT
MARSARSLRVEGMLDPGRIYHVTNRGVDRMNIFASDLDRVVFLSMLAEACDRTGAVCHTWALMTNHFRLVVEDSRGLLSQLLHRLEFCYARYFNDSRGRTGPLFEHRFADELIDSPAYFEDACTYVLLNPLRTSVPMTSSAESYPWSSAELVTSETTRAAFGARILARLGGMEAVLSALGKPLRKSTLEMRRRRLEALSAGQWMERAAVLDGRSVETYRLVLAAKAGETMPPVPARGPEQIARSAASDGGARASEVWPARTWPIRSTEAWGGFELSAVKEEIERMSERVVPATLAAAGRARDVLCYALYRFTSASIEGLSEALSATAEVVSEQVEQMRIDLGREAAWRWLVWKVEWGLRWRLLAGPHRA